MNPNDPNFKPKLPELKTSNLGYMLLAGAVLVSTYSFIDGNLSQSKKENTIEYRLNTVQDTFNIKNDGAQLDTIKLMYKK